MIHIWPLRLRLVKPRVKLDVKPAGESQARPGQLRMDGDRWHARLGGGEDVHLLPGRNGKDEQRQPLLLSPYARTGVWMTVV